MAEVHEAYKHRDDQRLTGALAGFAACHNCNPLELTQLLRASRHATADARRHQRPDYRWYRSYEVRVEWVCNVISVVLLNEGLTPIITPTTRGYRCAAEIMWATE